jgi:class 3 adenylate cyclase
MGSASVETVTILITDLVGSTGLASRIGPGAADELREEHFALLRGAVKESGGREVKNTGDGLIAAFDSVSEGVSCAVAVQQRFERRNRSTEEQLLIKVGISLGDATASDGDYFGMPVIEAARLCDRAQGGQILAKEIVAHLAGGRQESAFRPVGDLELKGLPEALSTVEVSWEPLGEQGPSLPPPARLQEMPPGGFVGRTAERERLTRLIDDASEGNRRLALISGEPGIGKTRLSTHTAMEAHSQGRVVLYGRCDEELAIPYGPWLEALAHYVEHGPEAVLRAHIERHGGELARVVPQLAERLRSIPPPRETDADTERYLLWGAVVGLLREGSRDEPLVLILDDLHWADKPTLLLLKHVVSQGQGLRALVIATYRESDLVRGHPLTEVLADLHPEQGVERIALRGLDEANIVEIMERAAGHELDDASRDLAKELLRESDGNPFYTAELLRHLLESGGVYRKDSGRWTVNGELSELGLPASVREVVGRRVERLGEDVNKQLSVAAVIGRDFDVDLLLAVSERSEDELLELLEQAVAASVLVESASVTGRFSFAHALINHTLYEDLGNTRRARLHRRIAEALEELLGAEPGARVSELAHHWSRATTTVDLPRAVRYARMAGERALTELAPDEGLRWFSQALELQSQEAQPDRRERCELLIGLGGAQLQIGDTGSRETLLEASRIASALADAELAARAALTNNRGESSAFGQIDRERLAAIERAIELDDPPNPGRRARLLALQAAELQWDSDFKRRWALAEEAISLARSTGDVRTLAEVLRRAHIAFWSSETLELRSALVTELAECAAEVQDPALQFWAHGVEVYVYGGKGEFEGLQDALRREQLIAEELGQPTLRWVATWHAAAWQLLHGDLAAAERLAERAFAIGQEGGEPDAVFIYGAQLITIRVYQGRGEEIVEMLEQTASAQPDVAAWSAGLASTLCWLDRRADAAAILEHAAKDSFENVLPAAADLTALLLYADAAAQTGNSDAASILHELIEPRADQIDWTGSNGYGHARMYLGLLAAVLGNHEQTDAHLAFACEFQEANGMLLGAARAHLGWAEALAARGETAPAREHAARALELSREHGYGAFEARAAALLEPQSAAKTDQR